MSLEAKSWSSQADQMSTVSRVLVHLADSVHTESLIPFAVQLAQRCQARVRGLTLVDTSQLEDDVSDVESAAYAAFEQQRLDEEHSQRERTRATFSQVCLAAGLDFDLHRKRGPQLEVLRGESKVHDLSMTSVRLKANRGEGEQTPAGARQLVQGGISPLLIVRESSDLPQRILLVLDESPASSRSLRSFLSQRILTDATVRLLAICPTPEAAKQILRDHMDGVSARFPDVETGYATGRPAQVVPDYAMKWEADLVVTGVQPSAPLIGRFRGDVITQVLKKTHSAVYAAN